MNIIPINLDDSVDDLKFIFDFFKKTKNNILIWKNKITHIKIIPTKENIIFYLLINLCIYSLLIETFIILNGIIWIVLVDMMMDQLVVLK